MAVETWPPSLKQYVQDVFACCSPDKRDEAQEQLRNLIIESHRAGTLLTTDWSEVDLPRSNWNCNIVSACTSTAAKNKKKKKSKKQKQQQPSNLTADEEAKRLKRLRRFEEDAAQYRAENVSSNLQSIHLDGAPPDLNQPVVGTCTKLEKNYLRLTSAPDPTTVRPLEILKKTLKLLKEKWKKEQNYTYICDQFKSVRQDLTVQHIKNEFTVQVYEIHARIALEKSDLGEYNQCQTQLKDLYARGICGHDMEFTAYRILYYLHTQNWGDVNSVMADLTPEQKENEFVKHALEVRSSLATGNYHCFFNLYKCAPNMGAYLMDHFCERERVQSLITLCKACRPDIPFSFIQNELAFDTEEQMLKFLSEQKAKVYSTKGNGYLDCKGALAGLLESQKKFKKIDIKGQL
ncbi:nuclear export factor [Mycotypha africana]|uniref:nuclear export factor n=1 Tax=Mycotypha africana TaxID=64632 RepID=UPI0023015462|nr:nuclear export factor [Mycotypha africana]KAI8991990.1 nuclear export factor [Mycotypha africana]